MSTQSHSQKWFSEGYQAALKDIADALDSGGVEAVVEWLENNRTVPQRPVAAPQRQYSDKRRPYRVSFTYPPSERCPAGIKAKESFRDESQADELVAEVEARGGTAVKSYYLNPNAAGANLSR